MSLHPPNAPSYYPPYYEMPLGVNVATGENNFGFMFFELLDDLFSGAVVKDVNALLVVPETGQEEGDGDGVFLFFPPVKAAQVLSRSY